MSKITLLAVATTVTLTTVWVAAQTPPPQVPPTPRPAVQGQPPQAPAPGQPAPAPQGAQPGQAGRGPVGPAPMGRMGQPGQRGQMGQPAMRQAAPGAQPNGMAPWAGLNLNDEQRDKVRDLQRATRDQAAPVEDELVFTKRSLHRELYADKRDNAKVTALATKIAGLEKQLADIHIKQAMAVADLLTPRQRETMRIQRGPEGRGPNGPAPVRR